MTVYKYLGYGVTNENGVAKLDHNSEGQEISHSYTGVGAGEIDVVASLDNPVSEGSIVSEPCNVLDCIQIDNGVRTDFWVESGVTVDSRDANGTYLSKSGTGNGYYVLNNVNTPKGGAEYDWNDDYCFEFDLIEYTGNVIFQFLNENNIVSNTNFNTKNMANGHKYSIEFRKNGTITLYQDNVLLGEPFPHNILDGLYRFAFITPAPSVLAFKNFKVYPI